MYLKSLEIHGFKSFAEPTEIELTRGLTAVVGPNGCGKSNVIDAIRWALGEQSARALRGSIMQDIIFNGGGRRGPLGMAEVTLRFDNKDRLLEVDRDEVRVTRRLFRDGQSEYLVNGQKARLRDIRELLMDTGAGARSAVFVEQGKIDALLHASPLERRTVLEEAAGIGKYKVRRKEAQARLQSVSIDRSRLLDLLKEVEQRHGELVRQAKKARRFVELRERQQALRLELYARKRVTLAEKIEAAEAKVRGKRAQREELERRLARLTAETESGRAKARGLERTVRELELTLRDLCASEKVRREQEQQEGRRAAECEEDQARLRYQLDGLAQRIERLDKEIEAGRDAAEKQESADKGLSGEASALEAERAALEQRLQADKASLERAREKLMSTLQEEARAKNRVAELEARARVLAGREDRLERKVKETREELGRRGEEQKAVELERERAEARVRALDEALDRATAERDEAEVTIRDLEEGFLSERRALDQVDARLTVLRQLKKEGQGLDPGVRAILGLKEGSGGEGVPRARGVLGVISDLLGVEADFVPPIEAALGPRAQWVLVGTRAEALELVEWLAGEDKGRARLLAVDAYLEQVAAPEPVKLGPGETARLEERGFLGWAADLARPDAAAEGVVRRLLEGVCVAEDLEGALALIELPLVRAAVTLDGELVTQEGILEGGSAQSGGRLSRLSEERALEEERSEQEAALDKMRADLARWKETEKRAAQALERHRAEHHEEKLKAFGLKKDVEERERVLARLTEEARLADAEAAEIRQDRSGALEEAEELARDAIVLREEGAELDQSVRELTEALEGAERERAEVAERLEAVRVRMARGAEQWEALKKQAARAAEEKEQALAQVAEAQKDLARAAERAEGSRTGQTALQAEIERLVKELGEKDEALAARRAELAAARSALDATRASEERARETYQKVDGALTSSERDIREAGTQLEELASRVTQDLGVEIAALPAPEPAAPGAPPFSESAAEQELGALKRQLNLLGAVNLEALEECDRLALRKQELADQTKDLTKAEENLRQTIKRLNDTSRKRFKETFDEVRGHFREIFRKLFGGGKADLELEAGVDILEAGVDILAKPPGKEARTISLLSGGEKVLATVALLFAVFRAKPGPFCILDEVDAALDEHNVGRFVSLVRDFLDRSQFLIVTHNKKTMVAADALYGVTMPEPGVSTPVSVRIREGQDDDALDALVDGGAKKKARKKTKSAKTKSAKAGSAEPKSAKAGSAEPKSAKARSAKAKSAGRRSASAGKKTKSAKVPAVEAPVVEVAEAAAPEQAPARRRDAHAPSQPPAARSADAP